MEFDLGNYSIDLKKKGFERAQIQNMLLRHNDTLSVYVAGLKPKTMPKAFVRSVFIPGLGQDYSDQKEKGLIIKRAHLISLGLSGYYYYQYTVLSDDFDIPRSSYEITDYNNNLNKARRLQNIAMTSAVIFYVGNVVDAILLGGYQPEHEYKSKEKAIMLSAASPGLGQMYMGYKIKGLYWYLGMGASLAGIIYTTEQYHDKYSNYEQARLIHNLEKINPEETYANMQSAYDLYLNARNIQIYSYYSLGSIYILNLVDVWFSHSSLNNKISSYDDYRRDLHFAIMPNNNGITIGISIDL